MSASIARRYFARSAASASFSRCSRAQCLQQRAQKKLVSISPRSFTACARIAEKKYTEDHEWIELSDDKSTGTIGVSTYAAKALGDVVYVELPAVDTEVNAGDSIGAVESVKSASDILSPVSGVVIEANDVLEKTPATINKSPEADGWIAKIKVASPEELDSLMDADAYRAFTADEDSK